MIEQGQIAEALVRLDALGSDDQTNADVLVTRATIHVQTGEAEKALSVLNDAVLGTPDHPVALLMLAGVLGQLDRAGDAAKVYNAVLSLATEPWANEARKGLGQLAKRGERPKVAILCGSGQDTFIRPIQVGLSELYQFKLYTVASLRDVQEALDWADVCWFEWCDDLLVRASNQLQKRCKIICRLHSFEVFEDTPLRVNWDFVDELIFVSKHVQEIFEARTEVSVPKAMVHNGIDLSRLTFTERSKSKNIAFLGHVNLNKNPSLLVQILARLVSIDPEYVLHIGGTFQELRTRIYFDHLVRSAGLSENVVLHGWVDDIDRWLDDKGYIISTSVFESFGITICQGMAKGLKPIVHNWPGARGLYPHEMLFNTIEEAVSMIVDGEVQSAVYRGFVEQNYSLHSQLLAIDSLMTTLLAGNEMAEAA